MKKTIICNIPMKEVRGNVFLSNDLSLPVSKADYVYPINSFLSQTICDDEVKAILLVKKDKKGIYRNAQAVNIRLKDGRKKRFNKRRRKSL